MKINGDLQVGDTGKNLKKVVEDTDSALERLGYTDYLSQCTFTNCELNGNFNYVRKINNMVIFNLSVFLRTNVAANTYFEGITIPEAVRPKANVVFSAFSHNTIAAKVQYIRHTDGHLVVGFSTAIPNGNELNLWGVYFLS